MDHLDYLSHERLFSISRDELTLLFCEKAMLWGGSLNFSTIEFAKDPRILNMVMTFVLTPWSHYNTIIESRARFFLSLMEDLSIDFPSHMIESIIEVYRDTTTCDMLIFILAITCILTHIHVTIPPSPLLYVMGAISKESIWRSVVDLAVKRPRMETMDAAPTLQPSYSSTPSSSSRVDVSLVDIMNQL